MYCSCSRGAVVVHWTFLPLLGTIRDHWPPAVSRLLPASHFSLAAQAGGSQEALETHTSASLARPLMLQVGRGKVPVLSRDRVFQELSGAN